MFVSQGLTILYTVSFGKWQIAICDSQFAINA